MGSPRNWLLFFASIAWPACGGETGGTAGHGADAGSDGGAWLRFELGEAPMAFGRVPWPDDLYLDARGRPKVLRLPAQDGAADPRLIDALRAGIESLDGFGANASVYFGVEGRLDPSSLPHSEAESMRPDATVFLVDVDPLSPTAHARLPVRVHLVGDWLVVRPAVGVALRPGGRYAAVVTTSVRAADGTPLRPSPSWRRVRDATSRPDDPLDARAHALHGPVLTTLGGLGIARDRIAGMAVFRVQRVAEPLEALRRRVRAGDAPVVREVRVLRGPELDTHLGRPVDGARGLGVDGGVAHDHVAALVHAVFDTPGFEHEEPGVHGVIAFDDDGRPVARRIERVPLTLVLPRSADVSALRVAIYQHGIGEERGEMLGVADALASAGWAVVGIDAPYHGLRPMGQRPDAMGRFTGAVAPDGFGDEIGEPSVRRFAGLDDERGELGPGAPAYLREALRQWVADLFALVRLVREGDWSAVGEIDPELGTPRFVSGPLLLIGQGLGPHVPFAAYEPEVGAVVLASPGSAFSDAMVDAPPWHRLWLEPLLARLGLPIDAFGRTWPVDASVVPELSLWQAVVDGADPLAFVGALSARPVDVLLLGAGDDEVVHDRSTEALAAALGASIAGSRSRFVALPEVDPPVRGNARTGETARTRVLVVHRPAVHGLLTLRHGWQRLTHPVRPPFETLEVPRAVDNPLDAVQAQVLHFAESWSAGSAELVDVEPIQ